MNMKDKLGSFLMESIQPENIFNYFDPELSNKFDSSIQFLDRFAFDALTGLANIQSVRMLYFFIQVISLNYHIIVF